MKTVVIKAMQNKTLHSTWLVKDFNEEDLMEIGAILQQDINDNLDNEAIEEDLIDNLFKAEYYGSGELIENFETHIIEIVEKVW